MNKDIIKPIKANNQTNFGETGTIASTKHTTTTQTALKLWQKPLAILLSLSVLISISSSNCFAGNKPENFESEANHFSKNQKQSKAAKTPRPFTAEDGGRIGWMVAASEIKRQKLNIKDVILSYTKEDMELIRKLSSFVDSAEKSECMHRIYLKVSDKQTLTAEENEIFQNYNKVIEDIRKMVQQKKPNNKNK